MAHHHAAAIGITVYCACIIAIKYNAEFTATIISYHPANIAIAACFPVIITIVDNSIRVYIFGRVTSYYTTYVGITTYCACIVTFRDNSTAAIAYDTSDTTIP